MPQVGGCDIFLSISAKLSIADRNSANATSNTDIAKSSQSQKSALRIETVGIT
jgi:hypothetical protein